MRDERRQVTADVTLDRHGEGADRKLCELVRPVEELEGMVRGAWSDVAAAEVNDAREAVHGIAPAEADQMLRDLAGLLPEPGLWVAALCALRVNG